jgi:hypothetical protein
VTLNGKTFTPSKRRIIGGTLTYLQPAVSALACGQLPVDLPVGADWRRSCKEQPLHYPAHRLPALHQPAPPFRFLLHFRRLF